MKKNNRMHRYNYKDIVGQIRYMCELYQSGVFDHRGIATSKFIEGVIQTCDAFGKTDLYINKIMDKELHLNG